MSKETQETKKEKVVETAKAAQVAQETVQEPVVYVGPKVAGLKRNTTYIKGIPKAADEAIKENPLIKKMFVKVSEIAEAKKQLSQENSALSIVYRKIEEQLKKQ